MWLVFESMLMLKNCVSPIILTGFRRSCADSNCFYKLTAPAVNTVYYVTLDQFTVNQDLYNYDSAFLRQFVGALL